MLSRDRDAVARHPDEADQALILRTDDSLEDAAGSEGCLPLRLVDEVMQLNQVNVIGAEPFERPRISAYASSRFRSPVLVAKKKSDRYVSIQGPILSSASP